MTRSANNVWSVRAGLDGADHVLLEELEYIAAATMSRRHGKNPGRAADLVILIAGDHIYAPAVRRLRLLGVPMQQRTGHAGRGAAAAGVHAAGMHGGRSGGLRRVRPPGQPRSHADREHAVRGHHGGQ
jgi:hypothetical protein